MNNVQNEIAPRWSKVFLLTVFLAVSSAEQRFWMEDVEEIFGLENI